MARPRRLSAPKNGRRARQTKDACSGRASLALFLSFMVCGPQVWGSLQVSMASQHGRSTSSSQLVALASFVVTGPFLAGCSAPGATWPWPPRPRRAVAACRAAPQRTLFISRKNLRRESSEIFYRKETLPLLWRACASEQRSTSSCSFSFSSSAASNLRRTGLWMGLTVSRPFSPIFTVSNRRFFARCTCSRLGAGESAKKRPFWKTR